MLAQGLLVHKEIHSAEMAPMHRFLCQRFRQRCAALTPLRVRTPLDLVTENRRLPWEHPPEAAPAPDAEEEQEASDVEDLMEGIDAAVHRGQE